LYKVVFYNDLERGERFLSLLDQNALVQYKNSEEFLKCTVATKYAIV